MKPLCINLLILTLTACTASTEIKKAPAKPQADNIGMATPISIGESFKLASDITKQSHEINVWTPPEMGKDGKTHPVQSE